MIKLKPGKLIEITIITLISYLSIQIATAEQQTLNVDGKQVAIIRDNFGVPHIFAQSLRGLYYGNGYAIAQDRLIQMLKYRRDALGMMAEVRGKDGLKHDKNVRQLSYSEEERVEMFEQLKPEHQLMLTGYADGVNTYIQEAIEGGKLPGELEKRWIKPWKPTDSIAVGQMMARRFGGGGGHEREAVKLFSYLKVVFGDEKRAKAVFDDIFFKNDPAAPTTIPKEDKSGGGKAMKEKRNAVLPQRFDLKILQRALDLASFKDALDFARKNGLPTKFGSYAWVVSPKRTASGNAVLVGGPQMGFSTPQIAHEVHLSGPKGNVIGMGFAGIPGVLIGHNDFLAWTTTSGVGDLEDIFIEKVNPENQYQYFHKGKYVEMEKRTEIIKVRGGEDVHFDVYRTVHGPVLEFDTKNHIAYAKAASYWKEELGTLKAIAGFNYCRNIQEFAEYASLITTSHNFLCATQDGDIGYWFCGRFPIRCDKAAVPSARRVDVRFPVMGTGEFDWKGYLPFEKQPQIINPKQGYLVNWNNKPAPWWDNVDLPVWGAIFRIHRIIKLIEEDDLLTFEEIRDITQDIGLNHENADYLKPFILEAAAKTDAQKDEKIRQAVRYLRAWNNHNTDGCVAKVIFDAWLPILREEIFMDDLGDLTSKDLFHYVLQPSLIYQVLSGKSPRGGFAIDYFNGKNKNDIIINALRKAIAKLEKERGSQMNLWKHKQGKTRFKMGVIPKTNRGTYIQVVELSKPTINGVNILPPGQSENPNSPHYSDQRELAGWWLFKPMIYRREQLK